MSFDSEFRKKLAELVKLEANRVGGFTHLSEHLERLGTSRKLKFDRRKLSDLVHPNQGSLVLRTGEIELLEDYLQTRGKSLGGLFERPRLTRPIVETGDITFLISAKPQDQEHMTVVSGWDLRALAALLRAFNRIDPKVEYHIRDVLLSTRSEPGRGRERQAEPPDLERPGAIISLGSSLANSASETLLRKMFQLEASHAAASGRSQPPFYFVWSADRVRDHQSLFASSAKRIAAFDKLRDSAWATKGVVIEGEAFAVERTQKKWNTYGFIVAQRHRGQIWVVLAGLTGPATYGAARCFESVAAAVPELQEDGAPGSVVWIPVRTAVEESPNREGERRDVVGWEAEGEPRFWPLG